MSEIFKQKQIALFDLEEERPYEPQFPVPEKGKRGPTPRRRAFVRFFLETHKPTESAIRAGYSEKNARTIAWQLLHETYIQEMISAEEEAALKRAGVTAERILKELACLAFADIKRLFREDGSMKSPAEWDAETAAAVSSLEVFEEFSGQGKNREQVGWVKKIKTWDKKGALEILAKHKGLLKENIIFPDKEGNPQNLAATRIEVVFTDPSQGPVNKAQGERETA